MQSYSVYVYVDISVLSAGLCCLFIELNNYLKSTPSGVKNTAEFASGEPNMKPNIR